MTKPLLRTQQTISGQPLRLPQGAAEVAAATVEIPVGGAIPIHRHAWSRLVYVEQGRIRIVNHDTGQALEFGEGQLIPEVVGQWHEGVVIGLEPVRLLVIDLVPPGVNNVEMRSAHPAR
ncbi:MAG TPA: cupin domain-containing protein [Reyranellaceae bacterium]|nr:cupin domain-containing protein [Reyranellaceae bacterium]